VSILRKNIQLRCIQLLAPPAVSFDAKAGAVSVAWPDQKDAVVLEGAKEGFTQMTLKREGRP